MKTVAEEQAATATAEEAGTGTKAEESADKLQEKMESELAKEEEAEGAAGEEADEEARPGECGEKGIGPPTYKSGKCSEEGQTTVVASRNEPLVLETLKAKLTGTKERHSISGELGSEEANGVFITFALDVTNLSHSPQELAEGQTKLVLEENEYTPAFEVQNGYEQESFLWQGKIQPQETMHGTITFDVPPQVLKKALSKSGNLDLVNFGTEVYEGEFFEQPEIGYIQLYK